MSSLSEAIISHARQLPEGHPLIAKKLTSLGSARRVGRAMSRLARHGRLLRAGRGVYVRPVESRFGIRPPSATKVVEALAASRGETIAVHGAMAANNLGLTTQVPVHNVFLTSGPSRTIDVGSQPVELRHAPRWQLAHAQRPAGQVIRALAWLGPEKAMQAVETLKRRMPRGEMIEVSAVGAGTPAWLASQMRAFA